MLGSFNFFQTSIWLGVDKVLQEITKSYKNELRHFFQYCTLIPRKCLHKTYSKYSGVGGQSPPSPWFRQLRSISDTTDISSEEALLQR